MVSAATDPLPPAVICGTCCYWNPPAFQTGTVETGQCRRLPPTIMLTEKGLRTYWPVTARHHWCGEHAVIGETEAPAAQPPKPVKSQDGFRHGCGLCNGDTAICRANMQHCPMIGSAQHG